MLRYAMTGERPLPCEKLSRFFTLLLDYAGQKDRLFIE